VISSLVSRFHLVLIDIAAGLGFARGFFVSLRFRTAMKEAVGGRLPLIELALDFLACFSKIDDVTHPVLLDDNQVVDVGSDRTCASASNAPLA
jgi:hypothetical protein